jgi:serpin B
MRFLLPLAIVVAASSTAYADSRALPRSDNRLAFDMYAQVKDGTGDVAFSPISLRSAFALLRAGARGETAAELERGLHLGPDRELRSLVRALSSSRELRMATALWLDRRFTLAPAMSGRAAAQGAQVVTLRIRGAAEAARTRINGWVGTHTASMIRELLPAGTVPDDAALVVTSAMSFAGAWKQPFRRAGDLEFTTLAGERVTVPQMTRYGDMRYADTDGVRVVELPYGNKRFAMDLIQPADGDLAALERRWSAAHLERWLSALGPVEVALSLPRFTARADVDLEAPLRALGVSRIFDGGDLSGLIRQQVPLAVSKALHEAVIEVDEKGTRASAATGMVAVPLSAGSQPVVMRLDRPFLFVLRDVPTGAVLFLGRVADPRP